MQQIHLLITFFVAAFLIEYGSTRGIFGGRGGGFKPSISKPSRPHIPSRPINRPPSRPNIRPPSRPIGRKPNTIVIINNKPVVIIRTRPVTRRVVVYPVYHPMPMYHIFYLPIYYPHHTRQPAKISEGACVKNGLSLFTICQKQSESRFPLSSQNTTFNTCCSTYSELACYIEKAGEYCKESDAKALMDHSRQVADYFGSTVCKAVQYTTWVNTCKDETKSAALFNANPTLKADFISFPLANGNEKSCMDKLRNRPQPEGDLTQKCLNSSLNAWDSTRRKLWSSQVFEPCCGLYEAISCLEQQADGICTDSEIIELTSYRKVQTDALSQGVCRAVPFDKSRLICRGESSASFAILPSFGSLFVALIVGLFTFVKY